VFVVWDENTFPSVKDEAGIIGVPKYVAVKTLETLADDEPFSAVKVVCASRLDSALVHPETGFLQGGVRYPWRDEIDEELEDTEEDDKHFTEHTYFFVQIKVLRPLSNWFSGCPANLVEHAEKVLVGVRETVDSAGHIQGVRGYFAAEKFLEDEEQPKKKKPKRGSKGSRTDITEESVYVPMELIHHPLLRDQRELLLFSDPDTEKELLGYVAGLIPDPALRMDHQKDENKLLVVFLAEKYEGNEHLVEECPVYLFTQDAARYLLRVIFNCLSMFKVFHFWVSILSFSLYFHVINSGSGL
jgi:hypothetical protein